MILLVFQNGLPKWSTVTSPVSVVPCKEPIGPKVPLQHTSLGIFHLLFTPILISHICDQTNLYAKQVLSPAAFETFDLVTPHELQAYIGFMILMGVNKLPALYDEKIPYFTIRQWQVKYPEIGLWSYHDFYTSQITIIIFTREQTQNSIEFGR